MNNNLKEIIDSAFYYLSEKEREKMVNKLNSFGNDATIFVEYYEDKISKVGIKMNIEKLNYRFYYSTIYDSEILNF